MEDETVLILCEKPDAAMRVAKALDENEKPQKKFLNKVPYYEATEKGRRLVIVPALGHLYTVAPKTKNRDLFPVFDFEWFPRYKVERQVKETRTWIEAISQLSQEALRFILATDYDIEGETIGYTILKYACGGKDGEAQRMKFSTLTSEELRKSYLELSPHIEFPMVEAGLCRHYLDAMYGINLSRALTTSAKSYSGKYATLSIGRVQGPTLKFLVEREKEINVFVPKPFWTIKAKVEIKGLTYEAEYERASIERRSEADMVVNVCKGKTGNIEDIEVNIFQQDPPVPFDLGALQTESYNRFRYTPRQTADIAERLYLEALISYPRTASQKLPSSINYKAILSSLSRETKYRRLALELVKQERLVPNDGKKDDPAHPAIYPTGNLPERTLSRPERNLWDLVVKRFMAVFGDPAVKQSVRASILVNGHRFYLHGRQILKEGWIRFYKPYVEVDEVLLPPLEKGEEITVTEIVREDKFTKPLPRHNPSSLLRRMEDEGIGTKATRAEIIETLYSRRYISGERITVSDLGFAIIETLNRYCPEVISVVLTRRLEERMDDIQNGNEKADNVLNESASRLKPPLEELKRNEEVIGRRLSEALQKVRMQERVVGDCPVCGTGKLMILHSRRTGKRFLGCTNFFKGLCKTSCPLPQKGAVKPSWKSCRTCGWPMILFTSSGRRPLTLCINPNCSSKERRKNRNAM